MRHRCGMTEVWDAANTTSPIAPTSSPHTQQLFPTSLPQLRYLRPFILPVPSPPTPALPPHAPRILPTSVAPRPPHVQTLPCILPVSFPRRLHMCPITVTHLPCICATPCIPTTTTHILPASFPPHLPCMRLWHRCGANVTWGKHKYVTDATQMCKDTLTPCESNTKGPSFDRNNP